MKIEFKQDKYTKKKEAIIKFNNKEIKQAIKILNKCGVKDELTGAYSIKVNNKILCIKKLGLKWKIWAYEKHNNTDKITDVTLEDITTFLKVK